MYAKALLALCLTAPAFSHAEPVDSTLSLEAPEAPKSSTTKPWSLDSTVELRSTQDQRPAARAESASQVHEVSVGILWNPEENLDVRVEASFEEDRFFIREATLTWTAATWFDLKVGQMFLPVGLVHPRDNWFSSLPPYTRRLLTEEKAIDMGAVARIRPFSKPFLYLEAGEFAGQLVREQDELRADPEGRPRVISLKSDTSYAQVFVSRFEHDLAFFDKVEAWGAGFELTSPDSSSGGWTFPLSGRLLIEGWQFKETQEIGPFQQNRAWLINPEIRFRRFALGQRYSESRGDVVSSTTTVPLALEISNVYYADLEAFKGIHVRAERVRETTDGNALRDEWVGRLITRLVF